MSRRYEPLVKIASGGTAAVYFGAARGALGFRQLVALKQPHAHLADDPAFRDALASEAKIAARLRHANVVDVRDVEVDDRGVQLVMDYVEGASLSELIRSWAKEPPPRPGAVAVRIVLDACAGLAAVHDLAGDDGRPLGLVHRDVSPANVLVGLDGVARIADFGLAKPLLAVERTTSEGALRGKLGYMAPEYVRGKAIDRRIDVFAAGVVLWEALARKRLFRGENDGDTLERVQRVAAPPLAEVAPELGEAAPALDALLARALAKDPEARIALATQLASELERIARDHELLASHAEVREAFGPTLRAELAERARRVQAALAEEAAPSPEPAPRETASTAPSVSPTRPARRARAPVVLGAAALSAAASVAGVVVLGRDGDPPARVEPRAVETDRQPRGDEPRARASARDAASAASAPPAASPRAAEPGHKKPRPNPYARP